MLCYVHVYKIHIFGLQGSESMMEYFWYLYLSLLFCFRSLRNDEKMMYNEYSMLMMTGLINVHNSCNCSCALSVM